MPYAEGRTYYDADSHLMELGDWLAAYADPDMRDRIRPLYLGGAGALADEAVRAAEATPRAIPSRRPRSKQNVMRHKGWSALRRVRSGGTQPRPRPARLRRRSSCSARSRRRSSVATTSNCSTADPRAQPRDGRVLRRGPRLIAVGFVPLADPEPRARRPRKRSRWAAARSSCRRQPPSDRSPTHPDYWPIWALLRGRGVPFMLHVGGGGRPLRRSFHQNGKPPVTDFLGGGENIRSKDYMVLHHPPETFLACMALDGIFEQFPGLRGGCIEQGALWVVELLRRLDIAQSTFQKTEPALRLPMKPSEYLRRQVKFTPFPTEPVGWMIEQAGTRVVLLLVRLSAPRRWP